MRLYWEVARRGFRRYATYRGATFAGVFTNTMFGFMRAYVYLAVAHAKPRVGGFDRSDLLTYTFVTQAMIMIVYMWGWSEVALRVRSGDVANDLARPYDFQLYWLSGDLGRALYHGIFRGIPPFLVGALAFHLVVPRSPEIWLLFLAALVLATTVSFALRFLVNLSAFYLLDHRGVMRITQAFWTFLSGFLVPITFFPAWLSRTAHALPFAAMFQIPIETYLGKRHGMAAVRALGFGVAWSLILLALGRLMLRAAERRLVVQGG